MDSAAVRSNAMILLLLLIHCLLLLPLFVGTLCLSLFCYVVLRDIPIFAIILLKKIELIDLFKLSFWCLMTISVLWLSVMVPRAGLQCVIAFFSWSY